MYVVSLPAWYAATVASPVIVTVSQHGGGGGGGGGEGGEGGDGGDGGGGEGGGGKQFIAKQSAPQ